MKLILARSFRLLAVAALVLPSSPSSQGAPPPSGVILPPTGYGSTNSYFGRAAALYSDWALIGSLAGNGGNGSAYLFEASGAGWIPRNELRPPRGLPATGGFGSAVALGDGLAAVGAPGSASGAGVVVLYRSNAAGWEPFQELRPASSAAGDRFGASLALSGDVLLIGAPGVRRVEVYRRVGGAWSFAESLAAFPGAGSSGFGETVSLDGSIVAVGAPEERAAFVFEERQGVFVPSARLVPWLAGRNESFGASLAVCAGSVLVGAPEDDDGRGCVYLFEREGSQWLPSSAFTDPWSAAKTHFGHALGMMPDSIAIGAPGEEDLVLGAVYVFHRRQGSWVRELAIVPPIQAEGQFGSYVAVYGDSLLCSIGLDDTLPFGFYGGAILIWGLSSTPSWSTGTSGSSPAPLAR